MIVPLTNSHFILQVDCCMFLSLKTLFQYFYTSSFVGDENSLLMVSTKTTKIEPQRNIMISQYANIFIELKVFHVKSFFFFASGKIYKQLVLRFFIGLFPFH